MALQSVWIEKLGCRANSLVIRSKENIRKNEAREGKVQTILEFKKQNLPVFEITMYTKSKM